MKIGNLIIFLSGVGIGSLITYKIVSDKYENLIDAEIESVKESLGYYSKKNDDSEDEPNISDEKVVYEPLKSDKKDYENLVAYYNYHANDESEQDEKSDSFVELHKIEKSTEHSLKDNIYIIPPYEYDAIDDYDTIELTLYNDNVLCDEMDEIVEDREQKVGSDFVSVFEEDDVNVVYVRNDILKCDYEISKDLRDYSDVVWGRPPHYAE